MVKIEPSSDLKKYLKSGMVYMQRSSNLSDWGDETFSSTYDGTDLNLYAQKEDLPRFIRYSIYDNNNKWYAYTNHIRIGSVDDLTRIIHYLNDHLVLNKSDWTSEDFVKDDGLKT
jgi:hypothetical protein